MLTRILFYAGFPMSLLAQDLPLTCTASQPAIHVGEAVSLIAWAPNGGIWTFEWSSDTGGLTQQGKSALWDLRNASPGRKTVIVNATRTDGPRLRCTLAVVIEDDNTGRGLETRRLILPRNTAPRTGYGMYSYVLLTPDGGESEASGRNLAALEAWYKKLLPLIRLEHASLTKQLNATFVPVDTLVSNEFTLDWIKLHYDYNRASDLLEKLGGTRHRGPYLVASDLPLEGNIQGRLLVLDASWATRETTGFWMDAFINQAAQERFDQRATFDMFALKLRTIVGVLASGLSNSREALASVTTVSK